MKNTMPLYEPNSAMGQALRYMENQWSRLTVFLNDPLIYLRSQKADVQSGARLRSRGHRLEELAPHVTEAAGPLAPIELPGLARAWRSRRTTADMHQAITYLDAVTQVSGTLGARVLDARAAIDRELSRGAASRRSRPDSQDKPKIGGRDV